MIFTIVIAIMLIAFSWGWYTNRDNHRIFDDWDNPSAWEDEEL